MAFKTQLSAAEAFKNLKTQAGATKQYLQTQRALMVAATCNSAVPLAVIQHLGQARTLMAGWAATPGLAAYASAQYDDPAYDVAAEFVAMRDAIVSARDTLIAMFPKEAGTGFILYQTIQADGSLAFRTFTAAQLAGAVAQIDSVIATIA